MQRLNEKWLRYVNYYFAVFSLSLLTLYLYFCIEQSTFFVSGTEQYGVNLTVAVAILGFFIYNILILNRLKKTNIWLAYIISFVLFVIVSNFSVEISLSSNFSIIFMINNYLVALFAVIYGPLPALFSISIASIVHSMVIAKAIDPTMLGVAGDSFVLVLRISITLAALYFLRNNYEVEGVNNSNYIERYFVNNEVVKLLTDSIGDGIIIVDNEGIIRSINPRASNIIQLNTEDILGLGYESVLKIRDLNYAKIDKENNPINRSLKSVETIVQEVIIERTGENQKYIDLNVSSIADRYTKELYGAVIVLRDISAKIKEEEARSDFISTASHEMRTPIASIEGFLSLAMNPSVGNIDEKPKEFLKKAHESTQHLGRLFQDLLISSSAEEGRLVNHPKDVDMGEFVDSQVETFSKLLKENFNIRMVVGTDRSNLGNNIRPLYFCRVDPDRMNELLSNLIENAIKYGDSKDIEVGITGDSDVVQIYVRDQGIGISEDDINHLFQKFYRVDSSSTRTSGGTGLGLYICRKIVELYGGKIWVESKKGEGSAFFFNLPRISVDNINKFNSDSEK